MRYSKCVPSLPVTYRPAPRFLTCSPLTYQLSPRSGASGYQNRVHKNHEYLIICPVCPQLHAFLSDRLITWGSTARRLSPPLLFTFHLTPALAQRGTLPNSSAHTLAIWQPAPGANPPAILLAIADQTWQTGKLPIQPKCRARYETTSPPRTKAAFRAFRSGGGVSKRGRTCSLRLSLFGRASLRSVSVCGAWLRCRARIRTGGANWSGRANSPRRELVCGLESWPLRR